MWDDRLRENALSKRENEWRVTKGRRRIKGESGRSEGEHGKSPFCLCILPFPVDRRTFQECIEKMNPGNGKIWAQRVTMKQVENRVCNLWDLGCEVTGSMASPLASWMQHQHSAAISSMLRSIPVVVHLSSITGVASFLPLLFQNASDGLSNKSLVVQILMRVPSSMPPDHQGNWPKFGVWDHLSFLLAVFRCKIEICSGWHHQDLGFDGSHCPGIVSRKIGLSDTSHFIQVSILGSRLWGSQSLGAQFLPRTLSEAVEAFEKDPLTTSVFGDLMAKRFVDFKRNGWDSYTNHVSGWKRKHYKPLRCKV